MLKDNLAMLRNLHGYSQEAIAEKVGISRQAYAKWESGATIPDVEKCSLLAKLYDTTIDALLSTAEVEGIGALPPAPIGKNLWGTVALDAEGRIALPKEARKLFDLKPGDKLIVGSDEHGIALLPPKSFDEIVKQGKRLMEIKKER